MSQDYGREAPRAHQHAPLRKPARYLVMIESGGVGTALLFLETHERVGDVDAGTEEVAQMTSGLVSSRSAMAPEWDRALQGHSAAERSAADVYTFDV